MKQLNDHCLWFNYLSPPATVKTVVSWKTRWFYLNIALPHNLFHLSSLSTGMVKWVYTAQPEEWNQMIKGRDCSIKALAALTMLLIQWHLWSTSLEFGGTCLFGQIMLYYDMIYLYLYIHIIYMVMIIDMVVNYMRTDTLSEPPPKKNM